MEEIKYPQVTITGSVKHEPPLAVSLTLAQETIIVPGAGATVGRWDEGRSAWVRDGIDKVNIKRQKEQRKKELGAMGS